MKTPAKFVMFLLIATITLFSINTYAETNKKPQTDDEYRWAVAFYVGQSLEAKLLSVFRGDYKTHRETLYTGELSYALTPDNPIRRFFQPLVSTVEIAGNLTIRNDRAGNQTFPEYNAYIVWRWNQFPWNDYLATSFAIGEGISYATKVPSVETRDGANKLKRFTNYLMLEATAALPGHENKEVLLRMHHRSGAYGLYNNDNRSTNAISLGFRYRFS